MGEIDLYQIPLPDTEPEPEPDKPPEKGTEPDKDIQPGKDTKPTLPPMPKLPEWCDMSISKSADFDFENPSSFLFSEEINTQEYTGGIFGGVRLVEAPSSQEHPVHVTVSISSSEPYVVSELHLQKMSDSLILQTPSFRHGEGGRHGYNGPCMAVDTTIYLQKDSKLEELEVKTKQLGISLGSGLDLGLRRTILATGSGKVASEAKLFYSRETRISVGAGSVYGHYNLRDLLSISTQSGSISVDVTPQDAAKDDEKPATLDISSKSGSIGVQMPPRDSATSLPKRDYRTIINTYVGSISGSYIHGSKTELESKSGSINADILPYSADDYTSTLSTFTSTGMSTIRLQSPYKGTTIKRMTSSHTAQTGSLNLLYPQEWEGNITGGTKTGSLTLRGKDVVIEEFDDGWANKRVTARKGKGHLSGKMDFRTTTGSVDVTIGDTLESRLKKECESAVHDIFGRPELPLQEEH